jgi:hypothetical protein
MPRPPHSPWLDLPNDNIRISLLFSLGRKVKFSHRFSNKTDFEVFSPRPIHKTVLPHFVDYPELLIEHIHLTLGGIRLVMTRRTCWTDRTGH